jgi:hypothetical protein
MVAPQLAATAWRQQPGGGRQQVPLTLTACRRQRIWTATSGSWQPALQWVRGCFLFILAIAVIAGGWLAFSPRFHYR